MLQPKCAECGTPIVPRETKVRFCCAACRVEWFANERRRAVELFRAQRKQEEQRA